ncbi:MAG: hypothetical protein BLM47_00170 [Candidatus Reconcilbacillus cellulovorans]|uniref:Uncharacterized protein n=1 Tax=Candidatus Reconcilbacillus cellulovorans TaxID=1906605 RepID=A0A2A6E458_9BACL|nr:MAG: hypothetical protein BLM47_00170 [Candidatus Reconcilbacillus cellulovorans]
MTYIEMHQRVKELEAEVARLKEENQKLKTFSRRVIAEALRGNDWWGGSIQDFAEELGLIVAEPFDPERHGEYHADVFEPGDPFYVFADILKEGQP